MNSYGESAVGSSIERKRPSTLLGSMVNNYSHNYVKHWILVTILTFK